MNPWLYATFGIILFAIAAVTVRLIAAEDMAKGSKFQIKTLTDELEAVKHAVGFKSDVPDPVLQTLTDPELLDAELEKSANLTEMRRARRRTLPRENAGPPARVSRMRIHRNKS